MQRSTNQARCNPSISLLHFYYSHSSHYSYCITNWLVARILYNLAHFLGIAHARSGCIALRPSTITLATPSEKWSFLMIVLRDHGQFSRSTPPPPSHPTSWWPLRTSTFILVAFLLLNIMRWGNEYALLWGSDTLFLADSFGNWRSIILHLL